MRRAVAGSEAAFPTPCLDPAPCPVMASVSSIAKEAGPLQTGNWTTGRLAMGKPLSIANLPDRRSPSSRGGEHGNRTTNPPHNPREKVSRVSSTGQGCATPDGALQVGGTMGDTVNDAARRVVAKREAAFLTPCRALPFPVRLWRPLSSARMFRDSNREGQSDGQVVGERVGPTSQPTGPALSRPILTRWRAWEPYHEPPARPQRKSLSRFVHGSKGRSRGKTI